MTVRMVRDWHIHEWVSRTFVEAYRVALDATRKECFAKLALESIFNIYSEEAWDSVQGNRLA